jgi:starvation-inducible DNA-binding protein
MHPTASRLPPKSRAKTAEALDLCLADGIDLGSQTKHAHWNVKGPHFAALHPLFDTLAASIAGTNDAIAERAVTLGATVHGTARRAAKGSRIPEYPPETTDGIEHVHLLAERFGVYLDGLRAARSVADELGDVDTSDLLTGTVEEFEKHAWFLHATLTVR